MPLTIPYVITVDTEEEWDWSAGYPTGPTQVTNIARLPHFQEICERYGATVTYFVNHAVLANAAAREVIQQLAQRPQVEIGMHIHPWNTPPLQAVDRVRVRDSFLHNLPTDWATAKLETVYRAFREAGLQPVSFRGGRYSTSPVIQQWLREHGFVADASILPFTTWADDGAPDYRHRDLFPVRCAGQPPLWELPLSLGYTRRPFAFWRRVHAAAAGPLRPLRGVAVLAKLGIVEKVWLNFENPLGEQMGKLCQILTRMGVPYLCFTMHSSSLLPGGSPYAPNPSAVERLFRKLETTLEYLSHNRHFRPATIKAIAGHLENEYYARDRHQPVG
ncbi:MAG: hypothetical protein RMJ56_05265 [Gemmataceae bacterium]|nr:hypothetical protein [Gemmata sp.]MDW8197001.1 hypothetical protein [Gemmataceae bacterium]